MDSRCQWALRSDCPPGWDRFEAWQELVSCHRCLGKGFPNFDLLYPQSDDFPYFRYARIVYRLCYLCPPIVWPSRISRPTNAPGKYSWNSWARCIIRTYIPFWIWAFCATARITTPAWWRPLTRGAVLKISSIRWVFEWIVITPVFSSFPLPNGFQIHFSF